MAVYFSEPWATPLPCLLHRLTFKGMTWTNKKIFNDHVRFRTLAATHLGEEPQPNAFQVPKNPLLAFNPLSSL
jgi:hypothetical protein